MSRSVDEWIGRTPDSKVPDSVRLRVFRAGDGKCYLTGVEIGSSPWQLEHVKPLSMGGENREANLRPALVDAHKEKTAAEATARAKADAVAKKHLGITEPKQKIQSAGFAPKPSKAEKNRTFYAGIVRRPMFIEDAP